MNSAPPHVLRLIPALVVSALVISVATANPAAAQCAQVPNTTRAIEAAELVFVGRVVTLDDSGRVAHMAVTSIWKGPDLPATVEVRGATASDAPASGTDRRFEAGASYLVIPENSREPFLASACSATQRHTAAANLIPPSYQEAAGATAGRPALGPSGTGGDSEAALTTSILPLLGAIVLIAAVWLLISWMRSLGSKPQADTAQEAAPEEPKAPKRRRRSLERDSRRSSTEATRRVKRNRRRWRARRRRQGRVPASASSNTASGSTDTS